MTAHAAMESNVSGEVRTSRPGAAGTLRPSKTVRTTSGASAGVEGELLAIRDARGRLVVAWNAETGELVIEADKDLCLRAPRGRVSVEAANELELRASAVSIAAGHYNLRADRIIERTNEAFRTVENLLETRAKHVRTIVSRTLELFGRRTTIASEEDTRIDGKRVLLG